MNVDISLAALKHLKELAQKATPGPWTSSENAKKILGQEPFDWWQVLTPAPDKSIPVQVICSMSPRATEEEKSSARKEFFQTGAMKDPGQAGHDARYIAACSPEVIIAMCDHIEKLWLLIDVQDKVKDGFKEQVNWWKQEVDDVREICNRYVEWAVVENEQLQKEADWLARICAEQALDEVDEESVNWWRKKAKEAANIITSKEYRRLPNLQKDSLFFNILAVDEYKESPKMVTDHTIKTINQSVDAAREKHPFFARDENHALALLMEEVGEVARAINDTEDNDRIKEELLHVIAICIRWIENDISL